MTELPDSFGEKTVQQMFDIWITPFIESGAASVEADQVRQALIVMPPGGPVEVLLNERAETLTAKVTMRRDIAPGEQVNADDVDEIDDLRPFDIDPAAGWMAFVTSLVVYASCRSTSGATSRGRTSTWCWRATTWRPRVRPSPRDGRGLLWRQGSLRPNWR